MKKSLLILVALTALFANQAMARDTIAEYSIAELLETTKAKNALVDIPLFFADAKHPKEQAKFGEVISNKKTNAWNKSDKEACEWVMLSALKALQERAMSEGMNAVVGIESFYKKREFKSQTHFQCGAGTVMAGVALKGTLIKI